MQLHSASVQKSEFAAPGALLLVAPRVIGTGRVRERAKSWANAFSLFSLRCIGECIYLEQGETLFSVLVRKGRKKEAACVDFTPW
jgi:hypothetical protein